ncbi:hypothetical protein HOP50_18g82110 [Chloropicon primus]|uniref:RING-type domain-containing protein n=2 Tax=Chloropicon primus TaxID=1764295 RepID=A0A5B8MYP6_9CHLO|nr:hypothetical protein A3770_18p81870 [Chloropicon primus]UPR04866.1 hypothetical protein HOP50_18g82110 [Chloropicon primus]|eukprot:QDZ25669.1 hypothetical protein A3770_18p81870 [Chloropicon primus]
MAATRAGAGFGGLTLVGYNAVTFALVAVALGMALEEAEAVGALQGMVGAGAGLGFPSSYFGGRASAPKVGNTATTKLALAFPYMLSSGSSVFVAWNAVFCVLLNTALLLKVVFFGSLSMQELQRLLGRLVDYALLKIVFVAAIASGTAVELFVWSAWFGVLGFVKLFGGLARDRFEQLLQTPSATRLHYLRNLLFVVFLMASNILCTIHLGAMLRRETTSKRILLMFDPLVIQIDLAYTLLRSLVNALEQWQLARQLSGAAAAAGSSGGFGPQSWQWMAPFMYYADFGTAMLTHVLTLGHYCHVWYLHGFSFQVVDSIILLNIRSLLGSMYKRFKTFMAFHCATSNLKKAFPDATKEELEKYQDVCAICKESMCKGKVLPCGHIFHLPCLRSWLEQGEHGNYTCPLCRFPLTSTAMKGSSSQFNVVSSLAQRINRYGLALYDGLGRHLEGSFARAMDYVFPATPGDVGGRRTSGGQGAQGVPGNSSGPRRRPGVRGAGVRPIIHPVGGDRLPRGTQPWVLSAGFTWPHGPMDPPPPSASQGFSFSQNWSWFSTAEEGRPSRGQRGGYRSIPGTASSDSELEGWVAIVQSILPHVSTGVIVRDLQRTRNVNVTVNNLLES